MLDCFFGDALVVLSCPFWSTVLQCVARLQIHTLIKILRPCSQKSYFLTTCMGVCLSVTLHIADLLQYYV